jgi:8-oxo-dGTP pyrophosphatase MutT (NUDIX family)
MAGKHLRKRGVAVVIRHDKMLLVKDKGKNKYSLPGGGVHTHESSYQTAARELYEETGLRAQKITWLGSFKSPVTAHKAFLVEAEGHVHLRGSGNKGGGELSSYMWWDMKSPVPIYGHVKVILSMLHRRA